MRQFPPAIDRARVGGNIDDPQDRFVQMVMGNVAIPADVEFVPYQPGLREGVLIHVLFDNTRDDPNGSDAALIKYLPGAYVPRHLHVGYEMVLVLQGDYVENDILYRAGSLIIRAPGTTHEMRSSTGCTILAMRDIPVHQLS